jgi:hypothetical protein
MNGRDVLLAVVIPTRNRASLAVNACESLLRHNNCSFQIFVSDNSTEPEQARLLQDYCAKTDDGRLTYLRPSELAMAAHWDWAMRTAMERSSASHFMVHYDRRITKPGSLDRLARVIRAFPDDVVTYLLDQVLTEAGGSTVWQTRWDDRTYVVETRRVLEMTAKGRIREINQGFPFFSNCSVPRPVLAAVRREFGDICNSTAPDASFTYRFCATHDRYIHFDHPICIVYASHRSAGWGMMKGAGGDFPDFMKSLNRPWMEAAPIPALDLGQNLLFHEYELVRRRSQNPAFKPIEMDGYLRELAGSLKWVTDHAAAERLRERLIAHGWNGVDGVEPPSAARRNVSTRVRDGLPWLRQAVVDLLDVGIGKIRKRPRFSLAVLFAARCLNVVPSTISGFSFRNDAAALHYALACPSKPSADNPEMKLLGGVDVTQHKYASRLAG